MLGRFSAIVTREMILYPSICFFAHKFPSKKRSTLKEKNLLPWGANSFLLE